ncbi:MAG: MATE family efflux transporter [Candidatus Limivicinus sp.]|jgi:putative MATE family efflux protein
MSTRAINLTEGSVTKDIVRFTIPLFLSYLLQQLYNSVDTAVVGQFSGSADLAAVGSTSALINLLIGFFMGLATGTGVLYAMYFGSGNFKRLKKLIDNAMVLSFSIGLAITAVGVIFTEQLLGIMHVPDDVLGPSVVYLRIFMSGTVVNMLYNVGAGMLRAEGDSTRPLIYLFLGGLGNLILDIVLVAYFHMGVAGAAIATVAAQTVTAVLIYIRLHKLNQEYAFKISKIRLDRSITWDIVRISVPCGLQSSMFNISNLLVQIKINAFGTAAIAGFTAFDKLDSFIFMAMASLSLSISTFVGQNVGAGKYWRIKKGIGVTLAMCIAMSGLMSLAIMFFFQPLIHIFTKDETAAKYAWDMACYLIPAVWFYSFVDILAGAVRGAGEAVPVTVITAMTICVFRVVWLELLLHFRSEIEIVYLCYPVSWILCGIATIWYYYRRSGLKKSMRRELQPAK